MNYMDPESIIAVPVLLFLIIAIVWLFFLGGFETLICGQLGLDGLAVCS